MQRQRSREEKKEKRKRGRDGELAEAKTQGRNMNCVLQKCFPLRVEEAVL